MTDMRARYRGRCARTFAMVLSCCFFRCESLLNRAARRLGGFPPRHSRREITRTMMPGMGIALGILQDAINQGGARGHFPSGIRWFKTDSPVFRRA